MTKHEKTLFILLMGSLWGAVELFGGDSIRACGIHNKSAYLFGLGMIIMYASKKVVDFPGSVAVMAAIACIFKTASTSFYLCQIAAVMINGIFFDFTYQMYKRQLNSSPVYRTIAAPLLTYVCYGLFAVAATFVFREAGWVTSDWDGIRQYLLTSAPLAAIFAIVTINAGYYLGNRMRSYFVSGRLELPAAAFRIVSIGLVAIIWVAGQVY